MTGKELYEGRYFHRNQDRDWAFTRLDKISDNSLWSIRDLLPERGFAVARVAHCPNAVAFDPKKMAFTNTATVFFPRDDLSGFPFDMLFLSNVYVFFYALAARMGILRLCRSDVYPTNLALLPWTEMFTEVASRIEALRAPLFVACRRRIQAEEELEYSLSKLPIRTLKSHLRDDASAHLVWGDAFDFPDHEVEVSSLCFQERAPDEYLVFLSGGLFDSVELNRKDLAEGLLMSFVQREGDSFGKSSILNLPIPVTDSEKEIWSKTISDFDAGRLKVEMEARLSELDNIVGGTLGLSVDDIAFIQKECAEDPFLRIIRPRYPGTVTRKLGFRTGLNSSERYS